MSEPEPRAADSATLSPPVVMLPDGPPQDVRLMCSFGGRIVPRPHDSQLRYVGGETRIIAVHRTTTFSALLSRLCKLCGAADVTIKYQLPNEELDALISVTSDEDLEIMLEEYDRIARNRTFKTARLRLFLFPNGASSISSLLEGSAKREQWFLDALNGGGGSRSGLERVKSEASSIVSEVPDYLFGLDNSEEVYNNKETKQNSGLPLPDNVSVSDPGSPAAVISSSFYSTSSAPSFSSIPNLSPLKGKLVVESKENQTEGLGEIKKQSISHPTGYAVNPLWHYVPGSYLPVPGPGFYVPSHFPSGNVQVPVPIQAQHFQHLPSPPGQMLLGHGQPILHVGQVFGRGVVMEPTTPVDGPNKQVYYRPSNAGVGQTYSGVVVSGGEELQGTGADPNPDLITQSS